MVPTLGRPQRVVIKIGSSSLTSRHGEISLRKLEKLTAEIVCLKDAGYEVVLVSSGAVAAGYRKLGCSERPCSLPEKQAAASIGQGLLMESYSKLFLSHGYIASQILITRSDFLDENRYKNVRNTLNVLLDRGIVPIVNENDTVTSDRLRFGDNDTLSAKVAGLIDAEMLIILSDIDGLYSADPLKNTQAKPIRHVTAITPDIEAAAGGSVSAMGTGGMKSKIDAAKIAMASGITIFLGNASRKNIVSDACLGRAKGTYFKSLQPAGNLNQKKKWIAFNSGPEGEIWLHKESQLAFIEEHKCLRFNDICKLSGHFSEGTVIRVMDTEGDEIGLGVVNISSKELTRLIDLKTERSQLTTTVMEWDDFVCNLDVPCLAGITN
ncbi:glutamate 5-kinase [Neobacillus dielmonensis]|uniref:glutamate 5-kinase n=1 Tax=Neobacillus dielmonensis TaxID=1347369 RepID=UPI0005A8F024|nr:glutamate 5-kinase [Neobacillus dielmonensis]